ncbi:Transglutaminase-like superfamily protein [Luteibacter sp. UNCMF331Sha3.1]|uniref:transglutaminase-like domain-containing protein n=1 Tax=Luteibacter sp. UNCMF331Sha3.1 TaxID=1502760 RepID=UPI0008D3D92F|nr:transglutaminase-like domain-containing protein [Luteibacter sp. UNCMF331Sha3.1]SEM91430.1 Transglutaminase-like superfamily protein [Luteibacter sp. UNCMF331Sha3.1]
MRRFLAVLAVLCAFSSAALADERWMTVLLDGRKVGSLRIDREVDGDRVLTRQVLDFRMTRAKTPLALRTELRSTESKAGDPLAFYASTRMSTQENLATGEVRGDGLFQISNTVGGQSKIDLLIWPAGATLAEGQRLAVVRQGFRPGTSYRVRNFDSTKQQVANVDVKVVGEEVVTMPDETKETLHHLRQSIVGASDHAVDIWVDDDGYIRRSLAPLLGFRLEMAACDAACAQAPDQDIDLLRAAMVVSPRPMVAALRVAPVRYTIAVRDHGANPFIQTDEQRVYELGDGVYIVDVGFGMRHGEEPGPLPEDTAANAWVQSDSPAIVALAKQAAGDAATDLQRMRRLRTFLSEYIVAKGLDVGYASALETANTRRGDCTEHAVLLTAMARSMGIPARVVTGIVYAERMGGANRVFIPHAWAQAWIKDRWISFDSAQRRFDSTHIAMGTGNGEPWRFFASMSALGKIRIDRAMPGSNLIDVPAPSSAGMSAPGRGAP